MELQLALKQVLLNKDLMKVIQTYKKGTPVLSYEVSIKIIKYGSSNAYRDIIIKRLEYIDYNYKYDITQCIKYNRHDILNLIPHIGNDEYFRIAFHSQRIGMISRYKDYACGKYVVSNGYDIKTLHHILKKNIIPEANITVCYRDGYGAHSINIHTLAHLGGNISFLKWYCNKKKLSIDLEELYDFGNYDAYLYFKNDINALNRKKVQDKLHM